MLVLFAYPSLMLCLLLTLAASCTTFLCWISHVIDMLLALAFLYGLSVMMTLCSTYSRAAL